MPELFFQDIIFTNTFNFTNKRWYLYLINSQNSLKLLSSKTRAFFSSLQTRHYKKLFYKSLYWRASSISLLQMKCVSFCSAVSLILLMPRQVSSPRVGVLSYTREDAPAVLLGHSHLLYIPDRWQGAHSLRGVHRSVHVCGTQGPRDRQGTHWTRITVHGATAPVRLTQLLLDQLPLLCSPVLKPYFHLKEAQ